MEGKKLKGKVKGILNAGAIIFQGPLKDGIPQEKTIILNGITVPMPGNLEKSDEAYAFEAREFVRKMLIGKEAEFYIDVKINEREFGRVLYQNEDIAVLILREGLGKLMENLKNKPLNYDKLMEAQSTAQKASKGMWATHHEHKNYIRTISPVEDPQKLLENIKGKKLVGIVEEFRTGPFKIYCQQLDTILPLNSPGIIIPIANQRAATDYKMFVEFNFLHRDVEFVVQNYDEKHETFVGLITLIGNPNYNIQYELVRNGFAKLSPSAVLDLDMDIFKKLKQALDEAQSKQMRLWTDFKSDKKPGAVSAGQDTAKEISARVLEVHSGDSLTIENLTKNEIIRVYLSNIRAPQMGNPKRNEQDQPWAFEAKEFLRKATIGKKVKVEIDFSKQIKVKTETGTEESKNYTFVSVILPNDKNVAELLLENGLAKLVLPRQDDSFSQYLKELKEAEERSKNSKVGINSNGVSTNVSKYNDLTGARMAKKARTFFDLIKDDPKVVGVVEAVLSGSLYKVRLDKQHCYVLLAVAGIRTLSSDKNIEQYDQYAKQATRYSKENLLQRDIEIEPTSCTPKGVLQGNILVNRKNFGLSLIEAGLAFIDSKTTTKYLNEYKTAEQKSKSQKIGIWSSNLNLNTSGKAIGLKALNETSSVNVSEIHDATEFYLHNTDSKTLDKIQNELSTIKEAEGKLEPPVKVGTPCIAKFSVDKLWYRARVEKQLTEKKYGVLFVDYGNYEEVDIGFLRKIPGTLLNYEDQAKRCGLAFLKVPRYDSESGEKVATIFRDLVWEKDLTAQFHYEDNRRKYCTLTEKGNTDPKKSINFILLSKGLAKIDTLMPLPESLSKVWTEEENNASEKKIGIWATNELSDEEDDY